MEMISNGSDLNAVNYNLETPLAYASLKLLSLLCMNEGVSHVSNYTDINWDNNLLLFQKLQVNDTLFTDYANYRNLRISEYSTAAVV